MITWNHQSKNASFFRTFSVVTFAMAAVSLQLQSFLHDHYTLATGVIAFLWKSISPKLSSSVFLSPGSKKRINRPIVTSFSFWLIYKVNCMTSQFDWWTFVGTFNWSCIRTLTKYNFLFSVEYWKWLAIYYIVLLI